MEKSAFLRNPLVDINMFSLSQLQCGATLVARQWVVTAAHCVWEVEVGRLQVVLGEHDFYHREQHPTSTRKLSSLVIHPDFDPVTFEAIA